MTSSNVQDLAPAADPAARHPAAPAPSAPARPGRGRASSRALALSLLALFGAVVALGGVGLTVLPMEAAHGRLLTDTPGWYQWTVLGAFASLLLWTVAGIAGLVLGVVGLSAGQGRARAIVAIVLSVLAPFLALAALMGMMGASTALV
jgi:hypothetical protein